jgi:hypothetical protein
MQKNPELNFLSFVPLRGISRSETNLFTQEIMEFLSYVAMRAEVESWEEGEEENLKLELQSCLLHLKRIALKEQIDELTKHIKSAETEENAPKLHELLEQFHTLSKSLHEV